MRTLRVILCVLCASILLLLALSAHAKTDAKPASGVPPFGDPAEVAIMFVDQTLRLSAAEGLNGLIGYAAEQYLRGRDNMGSEEGQVQARTAWFAYTRAMMLLEQYQGERTDDYEETLITLDVGLREVGELFGWNTDEAVRRYTMTHMLFQRRMADLEKKKK